MIISRPFRKLRTHVSKIHPAESGEMVWIEGSTFHMGSDDHYAEEKPIQRVMVEGSFIDATPVTNRQFRMFVEATGHVTLAEKAPDPKDYPGALPKMLKAGSLVFSSPDHPVNLRNWSQWWEFRFRANWRKPHENLALDSYERTSSVKAFPPNGYGLYDMIGNVWEWTSDYDRNSQFGELDKTLDEAIRLGWLAVDMKQDWKTICPFQK